MRRTALAFIVAALAGFPAKAASSDTNCQAGRDCNVSTLRARKVLSKSVTLSGDPSSRNLYLLDNTYTCFDSTTAAPTTCTKWMRYSGGGLLTFGDTGIILSLGTASGTNAISVATNGARIDLGTGASDYLTSDGTNIVVGTGGVTNVIAGGFGLATLASSSFGVTYSGSDLVLRASGASGKVYVQNNAGSGSAYIISGTPFTLTSVYANAVASTATYGGAKLPAFAFTATDIGTYVSSAASGAGTTTVRVSDGTNNCDFALNCASDTNTTGPKIKATTGGTCTFAASAALTVSITATTCATTQPTLKNIDVRGNWQ